MSLKVKAGEKVICPTCNVEVAIVLKDLNMGDVLQEKHFHFFLGQELGPAKATTCKKCGADWFYAGRINTKNGWR